MMKNFVYEFGCGVGGLTASGCGSKSQVVLESLKGGGGGVVAAKNGVGEG